MAETRSRSPNGSNFRHLLEEFGIRVQPYREARSPRPANVIYGGRTICRLMRSDVERCRTTIGAIQSADPTCFGDQVVLAVWQLVGAHLADRPRHEVRAMFASLDLAAIQRRAQFLATGKHGRMGKTVEKLATLIADQLLEKDAA
ncbi:MAG: hypothetical protein KL863_07490 [Rhizobium sp.]|nr:hypothetical protein [Rhizobium sp.]